MENGCSNMDRHLPYRNPNSHGTWRTFRKNKTTALTNTRINTHSGTYCSVCSSASPSKTNEQLVE